MRSLRDVQTGFSAFVQMDPVLVGDIGNDAAVTPLRSAEPTPSWPKSRGILRSRTTGAVRHHVSECRRSDIEPHARSEE